MEEKVSKGRPKKEREKEFPSSSKRGRPKKQIDKEACPSSSKRQHICFLHYEGSKRDDFTQLNDLENPDERLLTIHNVRDKRQADPFDSKHRMNSVCAQIPGKVEEGYGYHRDCYQHFTNPLDRLQSKDQKGDQISAKIERRRSSTDTITQFAQDCIFCNKEGRIAIKRSGCWTTEPTSTFATDTWKTVLECAERKKDELLLLRIRNCDLFAAGAHFHQSCRKKYIQDPYTGRSSDVDAKLKFQELKEAHREAFSQVCEHVSREVIHDNSVIKFVDLHNLYMKALAETNYPNPEYKGEKLKKKLIKTFGDQIAFCQCSQSAQFKSQLIYSPNMKLEKAVLSAFTLGSKDTLSDAAEKMRDVIVNAYEKTSDLIWPPTAEVIEKIDDTLPRELSAFLKLLISGRVNETSSQTSRLVNSIGQDICRAVTNGEWKMPKHILLSMTLRHLYRSRQLTTLLNRLGHCENYIFSVELETAIARALEHTSSLLSTQIIREPKVPSIFHSEFDNFDQLVNTLTGLDSVHTAHGIMIQEVHNNESEEHGGTVPVIPSIPKRNERPFKLSAQEGLPDCYVGQRKSPSYPVNTTIYYGSEESANLAKEKSMAWLLLRLYSSSSIQEVPRLLDLFPTLEESRKS